MLMSSADPTPLFAGVMSCSHETLATFIVTVSDSDGPHLCGFARAGLTQNQHHLVLPDGLDDLLLTLVHGQRSPEAVQFRRASLLRNLRNPVTQTTAGPAFTVWRNQPMQEQHINKKLYSHSNGRPYLKISLKIFCLLF